MNHYSPCLIWSEKLALRNEDLSPADRAALNTHVQQCAVCAAIQADYQFLDAQLRALPPSVIKSLLRLPRHYLNKKCSRYLRQREHREKSSC